MSYIPGGLTDEELRAAPVETAVKTIDANLKLGENDLSLDAFGRQKVYHDYSLFNANFTYSIPNRLWEEYSITAGVYTALTQTGTLATSEDGMLIMSSGTVAGDGAALFTKRHPACQPGRGVLFITGALMPNPTYSGVRCFGLRKFTESGVCFELVGDGASWTLNIKRRSKGVVVKQEDITASLPGGFDPAKLHSYAIQTKGNGGGFRYFVDSTLIYEEEITGVADEIPCNLPAMPLSFECVTNTGDELTIQTGCVDVTSEGGKKELRMFNTVSTGDTLVNTRNTGTAVLGLKIPRTISYGAGTIDNTRDAVASKIASWTRDEAAVQVWYARDTLAANLDGLSWLTVGDSTALYLVGGHTTALDDAFQLDKANMSLVLNEWEDIEIKNDIVNPEGDAASFFFTPGDILVVVIKPIGNNKDNATTLYFSEDV